MKKITLNILFIGFLIAFAVWLQNYLTQGNPAQALAEASKLLNIPSSSAEEIKNLIKQAEQEDDFRPWGFWMRGLLAEKTGKIQEALNLYANVNPSSPSYPDAMLSSVLLMLQQDTINTQQVKDKFDLTEVVLDKTKRTDLSPKLELAKALMWKNMGDTSSAVSALLNYRKKHTLLSKQAREGFYKILETTKHALSPAEQLEDVSLLIKEKEYELAESKLKTIQSNLAKNSQAKLETLLVEQELLRKTGKNAQADEILSIVSADGKVGLGDTALKKIIMLNWNDNKQDLALENFNRFVSRFPDSKYLAEIYYFQGRIFEEQNKNSAAKIAFEQALKKIDRAEVELKQKILRSLAWSYYRDQDYANAAINFEKLESISTEAEDLEFSVFWKEFSLKKATSKGAADKNNVKSLSKLKGYYSLLAANEFGSTPYYKGIKDTKLDLNSCGAANPDPAILKKLDKFNYPGLSSFLRAEIAWWITISKLPLTPEDDVNNSISKLNLFSHYHLYRDMIEQVVRSNRAIAQSKVKLAENCDLTLFANSYPKAYFNDFNQASANSKISPALALAIARSESGFDTMAVSVTDARGLMQLMQETAKKEGLQDKESLFDAKTNIALGTKHIGNLIEHYKGEKIYAIAAYNAGSTPVDRWMQRYPNLTPIEWIEHIAYPETKDYVKKVIFAEAVYKELLN